MTHPIHPQQRFSFFHVASAALLAFALRGVTFDPGSQSGSLGAVLVNIQLLKQGFIDASLFLLANMKFDVIIAACVGVLGYVVEHRSARNAERRQSAILRAGAQLNQLLVPLNLHFTSLTFAQHSFIDYCARQTALPDPPTAAADAAPGPPESTPTSSTVSKFSARWVWRAEDGPMRGGGPHRVACQFELPEHLTVALQAAFAKEPMSRLCCEYRLWVTQMWVPVVHKMASIIESSGHLLEAIPPERLREIFPDGAPVANGDWTRVQRGLLLSMWLNYSKAWELLLRRWEVSTPRLRTRLLVHLAIAINSLKTLLLHTTFGSPALDRRTSWSHFHFA